MLSKEQDLSSQVLIDLSTKNATEWSPSRGMDDLNGLVPLEDVPLEDVPLEDVLEDVHACIFDNLAMPQDNLKCPVNHTVEQLASQEAVFRDKYADSDKAAGEHESHDMSPKECSSPHRETVGQPGKRVVSELTNLDDELDEFVEKAKAAACAQMVKEGVKKEEIRQLLISKQEALERTAAESAAKMTQFLMQKEATCAEESARMDEERRRVLAVREELRRMEVEEKKAVEEKRVEEAARLEAYVKLEQYQLRELEDEAKAFANNRRLEEQELDPSVAAARQKMEEEARARADRLQKLENEAHALAEANLHRLAADAHLLAQVKRMEEEAKAAAAAVSAAAQTKLAQENAAKVEAAEERAKERHTEQAVHVVGTVWQRKNVKARITKIVHTEIQKRKEGKRPAEGKELYLQLFADAAAKAAGAATEAKSWLELEKAASSKLREERERQERKDADRKAQDRQEAEEKEAERRKQARKERARKELERREQERRDAEWDAAVLEEALKEEAQRKEQRRIRELALRERLIFMEEDKTQENSDADRKEKEENAMEGKDTEINEVHDDAKEHASNDETECRATGSKEARTEAEGESQRKTRELATSERHERHVNNNEHHARTSSRTTPPPSIDYLHHKFEIDSLKSPYSDGQRGERGKYDSWTTERVLSAARHALADAEEDANNFNVNIDLARKEAHDRIYGLHSHRGINSCNLPEWRCDQKVIRLRTPGPLSQIEPSPYAIIPSVLQSTRQCRVLSQSLRGLVAYKSKKEVTVTADVSLVSPRRDQLHETPQKTRSSLKTPRLPTHLHASLLPQLHQLSPRRRGVGRLSSELSF